VAAQADFAVIIAAAGRALRFGGDKLSRGIAGRSVLEHSIRAFIDREDVAILVIACSEARPLPETIAGHPKVSRCPGGVHRAQSVLNGLQRLDELGVPAGFVAVHDAARPAVSQELIDRVFQAARQKGAAVPGIAVADTIKRVDSGHVRQTLPRSELVAVQTPQAARRDWLLEAFAAWPGALSEVTDDAQLLEATGKAVAVVEGDAANVKVTRGEDLEALKRLLRPNKV
jgi:2-C-methyl-D-erythritol 4-phosphate cytidylyltransferase